MGRYIDILPYHKHQREGGAYGKQSNHTPVIKFHIDDLAVTITFSQEESTGVRAVILDILTEAYRERLQRASPYARAGCQTRDRAAFHTPVPYVVRKSLKNRVAGTGKERYDVCTGASPVRTLKSG